MRVLKYLFSILIAGGTIFLLASCGSGSATPTTTQTATVKLGNVDITVTGTGNLALENKQELSFGQTGLASQASTAKISAVNVVAGQSVKKGDVLVKADPTNWQDQLTTDQHSVDSANATVAQAKSNLAQAQAKVPSDQANDQATLLQDQTTLINDQTNLVKAQQNLAAQQDVQNIQNQIDNANIQLQQIQVLLQKAVQSGNTTDAQYWRSQITYLSVDTNANSSDPRHKPNGGLIGTLQQQMSTLLTDPLHAGATLVSSATSATQIQQFSLAVQQAQAKIVSDQAKIVIDQASLATDLTNDQASVINAQNNVVNTQNNLEGAQTNLTNDQNSPQEIDAPFDGLITVVSVSQGQIVQRSATLIEIADPTKFVTNILVTETDSESIKLGDAATISFNALTGLNFPGAITQIAPLATTSQGVVNYGVTVELTSTTPIFPSRTPQSTGSATSGGTTPTVQPTGTPATGGAASRTPPAGGFSAGGASSGLTSSGSNITLRDGLSATVTIPIQQANNVLIVPARAITRSAQGSTVQVVTGTTTQTVSVQTGLSDGTNTAITSGLKAGDVVLLKSTTSTTSNAGGFPGGGGLRIP
jgi:multidrug efflux pump subunit AcrA (membrane-fusion protein)